MTAPDPARLLGDYDTLVDQHAEALGAELDVEAEKPLAKTAAIRRLMEQTNPLTGKPHSASSADAVVESDPEYAAFLRVRRDIIVQKVRLAGKLEAARLRVSVALAGR